MATKRNQRKLQEEEDQFQSGDAGASESTPVQCSSLKKGSLVMITKGTNDVHACAVKEYSTSKPGKHGAAKMHLIGMDIFTNKKYDMIAGTKDTVDTPNVVKEELVVSYVNDEDRFHLFDKNGELMDESVEGCPKFKEKYPNYYQTFNEECDKGMEVLAQVYRWKDMVYVMEVRSVKEHK